MAIDPLPVPVGSFSNQQVDAPNSCSAGILNVTGDFPTWWTDNTSIATANGHQINGVAVGATNHYALSKLMYWGPREYADPCPLNQDEGQGGTNVQPVITGPNNTVWWFKGQNPNPSNYPVSINLTASCAVQL